LADSFLLDTSARRGIATAMIRRALSNEKGAVSYLVVQGH
jgi:hypothetical protein